MICIDHWLNEFDLRSWSLVLPPLMILISWLMVSNIYYPSFKKVDWTTQAKWGTFIISVTAISLIVLLRNISFAFLFLGYVFFGLFRHISRKRRALKLRRSRRWILLKSVFTYSSILKMVLRENILDKFNIS